jgi:siderophore synthetase component
MQDSLHAREIMFIGESEDEYGAQQSIRTLTNLSSPHKPWLKLSMSLVNTSTGRVLAPHTVRNAAPVSDWLDGLVKEDPFLRDDLRLILLREVGGISWDPPVPEAFQSDVYGVIGCIWRESLEPLLESGERAVPFNILTAVDVDGKPFIAPLVRKVGLEEWIKRLLRVSVWPILHFLVAHGVALESHAQNMVLILKDGLPHGLALKDFHDGIRFSRRFLREPQKCPPMAKTPEIHARVNRNSFIETDRIDEVRDFVLDAFFFINLGELALFLDEWYDLDEKSFWELTEQTIREYRNAFPELEERLQLFDVFGDTIRVEQLTKRRLFPETELRVHSVPNPLAKVCEGERR